MKKIIYIKIALIGIVLFMGGSSYCDNWAPFFENDYIKMGAQAGGNLCGVLNIKRNESDIYVWAKIWRGSDEIEADITGEWIELTPGDNRFQYDWGGRSPQTHYRVYCGRKSQQFQTIQGISCEKVVTINSDVHNRVCGTAKWIGGTGASYGALKMDDA